MVVVSNDCCGEPVEEGERPSSGSSECVDPVASLFDWGGSLSSGGRNKVLPPKYWRSCVWKNWMTNKKVRPLRKYP